MSVSTWKNTPCLRWQACQLVRVGYLYRALPGASSWLTANGLERRLGFRLIVLESGQRLPTSVVKPRGELGRTLSGLLDRNHWG
jgi:hypothetical protein